MPVDSTPRGIDWNTASTEGKLEFFYGWCSQLETRVNEGIAEINDLRRRLNKIEETH
jgi:hypothetical protein